VEFEFFFCKGKKKVELVKFFSSFFLCRRNRKRWEKKEPTLMSRTISRSAVVVNE